MNQERFESDHIFESHARIDMEKEVGRNMDGENHAANDEGKEVDGVMEAKSHAENDSEKEVYGDMVGGSRATYNIEQDMYLDLKDEPRVTSDTQKEVDVDKEGESHATNELERGADHKVEGDSHATNNLTKEVDDRAVPKVGMTFGSIQEAYSYYNSYAREFAFSVRKQNLTKSRANPTKIQVQTYCCSREGFYDEYKGPKKRKEITRVGCKAMFEVRITDDNNYKLTKFIAEHNHEFVSPENLHLLRSQRKVDPSEVGHINKVHAPIQQWEIFSYICEEASQTQNHNSIQSDCINLEEKKRVEFLKRCEAQRLLDYFKHKKQENKHYFYSFWTNEDFKIRGIFFCDGKSRRDYNLFGDALYLDTTFRTSDYTMVFVPILGVNSHGQTTLFGCGLLEDETTDAFVWLLTTFLEAMGERKPKTIFTNQCIPSAIAIGIVFPETRHRLYLWHIYQNVAKHLDEVFVKFKSISQRFKECIYDAETVEEFEESWELLLKDYGLKDNKWLQGLYEIRQKWAQVYDHVHFCACMTTTQMSENIYNYMNSLFGSTLTLRQSVDQYTKAMIVQCEREMEAESNLKQKKHFLFSNWPIEHEAAKIYTHKIFCFFQDEYKRTLNQRLHLKGDDGAICTYEVIEMQNQRRNHTVTYNRSEQLVACTCRKFEFHGIICSHALKVYCDLELTTLPSQYYLKRWTRDATDEFIFDSYGEAILSDINPLSTSCYRELSYISQRIVIKGAKSSTIYRLAKSMMLELEAKVAAFLISAEEERSANEKNTSGTHENLVLSSNSDVPVRNREAKRSRGRPKNKVTNVEVTEAAKKMIPPKQNGSEEESVTKPNMNGRGSAFDQPIQESFGFMNQLLYGEDQNQVLLWPDTCIPYNFMGCPEQTNVPVFPSGNLFMSQQESIVHTHERQGLIGTLNFSCSSTSWFQDSSTS